MAAFVKQLLSLPAQKQNVLRSEYGDALVAFVPSVSGLYRDVKGKAWSAAVSTPSLRVSPGGIGVSDNGVSRTQLEPAVALPTLSAATLIVIQRSLDTSANGWHKFDGDNSNSHFGFAGLWYTSTFSTSRWLGGVSFGIDVSLPHVAVVTAFGTNRAAYINGRLVGSSSSSDSLAYLGTPTRIGASSDAASYYFRGDTYALIVLPRSLSAAEIASKFYSPAAAWASLFATTPYVIWIPSAGGGATQALTGSSATTAAGTTAAAISKALTGAAATSAAGTTAATISALLSGIAATTATGTTTATDTVALTGIAATSTAGSVSAGGDASAALTGTSATTATGTTAATLAKALTGTATTTTAGITAATITKALTGTAATTTAGTTAATDIVALTGTTATSAAGSVSVNGNPTVALAGTAVTTTAGTTAATLTKALAGAAATAAAGTSAATISKALTGTSATAAAGTVAFTKSATVALTGFQAVVSAGNIVVAGGGVSAAVSGSSVTAATGTLTATVYSSEWVPVADTAGNSWVPVSDSNANTWTPITT